LVQIAVRRLILDLLATIQIMSATLRIVSSVWLISNQWPRRNILTGGPWTNYIKGPGPIPHFEFTEEFIIIKVLNKIKHKTMMKCEVKSNFIIKAKLSV